MWKMMDAALKPKADGRLKAWALKNKCKTWEL